MQNYARLLRHFLLSTRWRRFFFVSFAGICFVSALIVYGVRWISHSSECLLAHDADWNTTSYWHSTWGDTETGEQLTINSKQPANSPYMAADRPAIDWAVQGQHQAFLEISTYNSSWSERSIRLVMIAPEQRIFREFPITAGISASWWAFFGIPEFIWSSDGSGNFVPSKQLHWSPDGRYILFVNLESMTDTLSQDSSTPANFWHYSLFGLDGSAYQDLLVVPQSNQNPFGAPWIWTSDSHVVFYPQFQRNPPFYPPSVAATDRWVLVPHSVPPSPYEKDADSLRGLVHVEFTINGSLSPNWDTIGTFVADPHSLGSVDWSPDGNYFAMVFASGKDTKRKLNMTWGRKQDSPDPPVRPLLEWHILDDQLWEVRNLVWLSDSKSLAYIAQRKEGYSVEVLDLNTGEHHRLGTTFANIALLNQVPATGVISFWWRNYDGQIGISSFSAKGELLHDTVLPVQIDGLEIFRDPYRWVQWPEIYPSPDGRVFAIVRQRSRDFSGVLSDWYPATEPLSLELIASDGSWARVLFNSKTMGAFINLVWSSDGRAFMFAYSNSWAQAQVNNIPTKSR